MTSGTIKFYVNDQLCLDTSGVGVNAVGGVFNCGLKGTRFKAICDTICWPKLAVRELKLWKGHVLNVVASNNIYTLPGNDLITKVEPLSSLDINKVLLTGSFSKTDFLEAFIMNKGTGA